MQPPASPFQPVAPPSKKLRSSNEAPVRGGGRDALSTATDDAIARRRAELRRLQLMRSAQTPGGSKVGTKADDLMTQARTQLSGAGRPPVFSVPTSANKPSAPAPPRGSAIPQPQRSIIRHSDIFPNVTKFAPSTEPPKPVATPAIQDDLELPPPTSEKKDESTKKVARKLETTFSKTPLAGNETTVSRPKSAPPIRPPGPPPKLVVETPILHDNRRTGTPLRPLPITPSMPGNDSKKSPFVETPETEDEKAKPPPSTVRRDFLRSMRDFADSPGTDKASSQLRMMQELKMAQQDKEDAFRKVARLQEQVQQLQKEDHSKKELEVLVALAEERGDAAALQWAKSQVSGMPNKSNSPTVRYLNDGIIQYFM